MTNPSAAFQNWLKLDSRIYWISGKPGSGKSTLTNYIAEHASTRSLLEQWSGSQDLLIIESYLWNAGTSGQKSFHGLLATLLRQILQERSDVVDSMLRYDPRIRNRSAVTDWSIRELEAWLMQCFKQGTSCFCMFIDGPDEAELEYGVSENSIIQFIETVATFPNVKCCVSSRPLRKFEVALKDYPQLHLQELNARDILRYFDDNLSPLFQDTSVSFMELRDSFVEKAGGVFLWACLAVASLRRGVDNCDGVDELCQRLEQMPPELEDLYAQMWARQNHENLVYRGAASWFFNIHFANEQVDTCPTLLDLVLSHPDNYHLSKQILQGEVSQQLEQQCETIQIRVPTHCAGLLVSSYDTPVLTRIRLAPLESFPALHNANSLYVEFVHRTARDFLLTSSLGQAICSYAKPSKHELERCILHGRFCRYVLEFPDPRPLELVRLLYDVRQLTGITYIKSDILEDVEAVFRDRVLRLNPHLGLRDWDYQQPANRCRFRIDFLGAMVLGHVAWLSEKALTLHKPGSLGPEYTAYMLCCWLSGRPAVDCSPPFPPDSLVEHVRHEASSSTYFLHQTVHLPIALLHFEQRGLGVRVCVSEWYLQAVRFVAKLWKVTETTEKLSTLTALLDVPLALHERCFIATSYCRSSRYENSTIELWSLSAMRFAYGFNTERSRSPKIGVILECNVAFLLQVTIQYLERVCTGLGIDFPNSERNQWTKPFIRPLCFLEPRRVNPATGYSALKRLAESESDILCAVLRSGRTPETSAYGGLLTWSLTEQEYKEIAIEFDRLWDAADEVPFHDYMYELGHAPMNGPEVVQWPPLPLQPEGMNARLSGDSNQIGKNLLSDNPRTLDLVTSASSLLEDPEDDSEEDRFFNASEGHA